MNHELTTNQANQWCWSCQQELGLYCERRFGLYFCKECCRESDKRNKENEKRWEKPSTSEK